MEDIIKSRYKWFYTRSGKLVVGGKNAGQNDELLKKIKGSDENYIVMHTAHPGSPFCVIISKVSKVNSSDLEECATFTGCLSRAWKQGKKKTEVHIFKKDQVSKEKGMKTGTWRVKGEIRKVKVDLKLVLVKQDKVYRAVPEKSARKKDVLLKICPGRIDKKSMVIKIAVELGDEKAKENELLSALPAGGVKVCNGSSKN